MGVSVFYFSVVIFIPLIMISVYIFLKSKKNANIEHDKLKINIVRSVSIKISLFAIYAISMMLAHYEYWLNLMHWLTGGIVTSNNWTFLHQAVLGWDSWYDIIYYWIALFITYLIVLLLIFIIYKKYDIRLYKNNNYVASTFNIGLYPFMVISFIGWVYKW